jgi:hypothetical protein
MKTMARSKLRTLGLPVRMALGALLAVGLTGWGVSVHLTATRSGGSVWSTLSPEACRLRTCAPPLERAIHTTMGHHIPDPRERRVVVTWIRHGARMNGYYGEPSRILAKRCQTCHGASPQASIRLLTYGDALALAQEAGPGMGGRDPYHRLRHLHVHLFSVGAVLGLLLLGLAHSRYPRSAVLGLGLGPVVALVLSVGLTLWGCGNPVAQVLLWLCEGLAVGAWPVITALLAWDLFAPEPGTIE